MIGPLQSLRFLFASMIFLHHFPVAGRDGWAAGGPCGVSFFLVLSGFVLSAGYGERVRSVGFDGRAFFRKRWLRIYPLHLLCLAGYLLLHVFRFDAAQWLDLVPNLLLLQSWFPAKAVYFSGNAVSWCLSDLLFFYALFPLLARSVGAVSIRQLGVGMAGVLCVYLLLAAWMPADRVHAFLYVCPLFRLVDFLVGICLYRLFVGLQPAMRNLCVRWGYGTKTLVEVLPLLLLGAGLWLFPLVPERWNAAAYWWIPISLIILLYASCENIGGGISRMLSNRRPVRLGELSFTFYLIHQMGIGVLTGLLHRLSVELPWPLACLSIFILLWGVSYGISRYFEQPVTAFLTAKLT